MALRDPGATAVRSRMQWITAEDSNWSADKAAEAWVIPDGSEQVVVYTLEGAPGWRPGETLTGLQFEFTTSPYPGQLLAVRELRAAVTR